REAEEAAAVLGDVLHRLAFNRVVALGALRLQFGGARRDGDGFSDRTDFDGDHAQRQAVTGVGDDVLAFGGLEAVHRDAEGIGIRFDDREDEIAFGGGYG